jgi:hypothetical protein
MSRAFRYGSSTDRLAHRRPSPALRLLAGSCHEGGALTPAHLDPFADALVADLQRVAPPAIGLASGRAR